VERDGEDVHFKNGSHRFLIELRDGTLRSELQSLDSMTMNFIDLVNDAHRTGYGTNGKTGLDFFTEHPFVPNVAGNYDRNGDGQYDSSYIFRISGVNRLESKAQIGLEGTISLAGDTGTVSIPYYPTDTVSDVVTRINNAGGEVVARLDREGRLTLKGTPSRDPAKPDFVIRHVEDSGYFWRTTRGSSGARGPREPSIGERATRWRL